MQYISNDPDMIKSNFLPMLECLYGSKGKRIPEIEYLTAKFPYSNEKILCIKNNVDMHKFEKNFNNPLCKKYNSSIYSSECRNDVERFSDKIQLIIGAVIHDGSNVLYLEAINQKIIYREHNYTMALGHVSSDTITCKYMSPSQIFRINLAKELSEELNHTYYTNDFLYKYYLTSPDVRYIGTFTSNEIPVSNKHILIAYDVMIYDIHNFVSNEPHKHKVHVIPMDKLHTIYERLDSFFLKSISHIPEIKSTYRNVLTKISDNTDKKIFE